MATSQTSKPAPRSFTIPGYITVPMKWLSRWIPSLALSWALYLFFRPLQFPVPEREKGLRKRLTQEQLKTASGAAFHLWRGGQGKEKIIFLHGWSGRGSQFKHLLESLEPHFQVFMIDAPGHGDFKGSSTHMLTFVDAVEEVNRIYGPFQHGIGHSLGGMALFNAQDRGLNFRSLTLIGSPVSVEKIVQDFCEKINSTEKIGRKIIQSIEKQYNVAVSELSTDTLAQKHPLSGLIAHDTQDRDVPFEHGKAIQQAWPRAQMLVTQGQGHRKILQDPQLIIAVQKLLRA